MIKYLTTVATLGLTLAAATPAFAADGKPTDGLWDITNKDKWLVRFRIINVDPDENSSVTGLKADVTADDSFTPEVDFSYFFTKHIAAELILATSKHDMGTNNGVDLGDVWVLPPTLTLQYHFNPEGTWRPYAGAGIGYIMYYNEDSGTVNNIKYEDGVSYALQAGVDYAIDEHWALNADIKKLYHNTDVSINNGAITADVDLNPWVFGIGVAYKF